VGVKWARASKISFSHDDMYGMDEGEADALSELELLGEEESDDTGEADRLEARRREEEEARRWEGQEKKRREEEEEEAKRRDEEEAKRREEAEAKRREEEQQQAEQAQLVFQVAWNQLGYDACFGNANAGECKALDERKLEIELACKAGTKEGYDIATKRLPSLGQLIAKIGKADEARKKYQVDSQKTLISYDEKLKVNIANLATFRSSKVKELKESHTSLSKAVNEEVRKPPQDIDRDVVDGDLEKIETLIDNTNDDVDLLRSKEQDP
jgi:hypothetical protein